jgi:hypothetical protein
VDIIRTSPAFKYLATLNDLNTPLVISKGFAALVAEVGYTFRGNLMRRYLLAEVNEDTRSEEAHEIASSK